MTAYIVAALIAALVSVIALLLCILTRASGGLGGHFGYPDGPALTWWAVALPWVALGAWILWRM